MVISILDHISLSLGFALPCSIALRSLPRSLARPFAARFLARSPLRSLARSLAPSLACSPPRSPLARSLTLGQRAPGEAQRPLDPAQGLGGGSSPSCRWVSGAATTPSGRSGWQRLPGSVKQDSRRRKSTPCMVWCDVAWCELINIFPRSTVTQVLWAKCVINPSG